MNDPSFFSWVRKVTEREFLIVGNSLSVFDFFDSFTSPFSFPKRLPHPCFDEVSLIAHILLKFFEFVRP